MTSSLAKLGLACALCLCLEHLALAQSFDYVMGMEAYPFAHDPRPAKGEAWANAPFGVPVARVSDQAVDGFSGDMMRNFYAKHDHENADGSLVMLHDGGRWHLYSTADWSYQRELPARIWGWTEPRWDPVDPDIFYFVEDMTFHRYDISDDSTQLLHDFATEYPGGTKVWNEHEGDSSLDARYWAFMVVGADKVICYDRQADAVVGEWDDPGANWVGMSMTGEWVVLGTTPFTFHQRGTSSTVSAVAGAWGHADLALDAQGRDVIFYMNNSHDWYSYTLLETGEETRMYHVEEWGFGAHMSGNAAGTAPGWGLVSTFFRGASDWSSWQPDYWMYNAIYMVELSPTPRIWRVAHAMTASTTYWEDTMATINRAGTRVYWGSNWMDPDNPVDAYVAELPTTWYQDLGASDFDAGPQPDAWRADSAGMPDSADGRDRGGAQDSASAPDLAGGDTAERDAGPTPDGAGAPDGAVQADGGSCVVVCLDEQTLQSCDGNGNAVPLRCPSGQRCEQARCVGEVGADAGDGAGGSASGCGCGGVEAGRALPALALVAALAGWGRRRPRLAA